MRAIQSRGSGEASGLVWESGQLWFSPAAAAELLGDWGGGGAEGRNPPMSQFPPQENVGFELN